MAKRKSVLLRLEVRPAGRRCACRHSKKHTILKGEPRFIVQEPGAAAREYGYCAVCAEEMLAKGEERLAELRTKLN